MSERNRMKEIAKEVPGQPRTFPRKSLSANKRKDQRISSGHKARRGHCVDDGPFSAVAVRIRFKRSLL
jgi:ribosomal protein L16/L10AE